MENISEKIRTIIQHSIDVKAKLLEDGEVITNIAEVAELMAGALEMEKKILFCGNGGSAADAQHLAAELSGRFYLEREPLNAEALHVNASYITAVANDFSFDEVYSRLVKAKGRKGDILFCISTSGNSRNILKAAEQARDTGILTVALTGEGGGKLAELCNFVFKVPSTDTPRIQEAHILIGHILCQLTEEILFNE